MDFIIEVYYNTDKELRGQFLFVIVRKAGVDVQSKVFFMDRRS